MELTAIKQSSAGSSKQHHLPLSVASGQLWVRCPVAQERFGHADTAFSRQVGIQSWARNRYRSLI